MNYISSRGGGTAVAGAEAIRSGIAVDGGLFVPLTLPVLPVPTGVGGGYIELVATILAAVLPDYSSEELRKCSAVAYAADKFDDPDTVPLTQVGTRHVLELWHGPTSAFKDMALQIMPHLMSLALKKTAESSDMLILVATSGDTGKAALEGFRDVARTRILVFYPSEGVSEVQRAQMVTQDGNNVGVVAVEGNFDDAQTGVKKIFSSVQMREVLAKKNLKLSSANSINWGRLAPQIAYYFSAYRSLCETGKIHCGDPVNFVVPTGNFGNILAGYYAKQMGLPINRLICASNDNNVLTDFLRTGVYDRNRPFHQTISPSMDILISSNLERLIYRLTGEDAQKCAELMQALSDGGEYTITEDMKKGLADFYGNYCSEEETNEAIHATYKSSDYVIDPHTAVAAGVYKKYLADTDDHTPTVIASTASPYKFTRSVMDAVAENTEDMDDFALADRLSEISGVKVPKAVEEIRTAPVLHDTVVDAPDMPDTVKKILGIK